MAPRTHPRATVLQHRVRHQRVDLRVSVSEACFARLAYGWYPHLEVTVDGAPAEVLETAGHFIARRARLSPLRRVLLTAHVLALMGLAGFWFRSLWQRRGYRRRPAPDPLTAEEPT